MKRVQMRTVAFAMAVQFTGTEKSTNEVRDLIGDDYDGVSHEKNLVIQHKSTGTKQNCPKDYWVLCGDAGQVQVLSDEDYNARWEDAPAKPKAKAKAKAK